MNNTLLIINNIHKSFGEQKVLQGLTMTLEEGKVHTLVGGNGTGKTTLFNLITAFLRPDSGEIWYKNKRLDKQSPVSVNYTGITRTFQDLRIIKQLTVRENILLSFKHNPGEQICNAILPQRIFRKPYRSYYEKAEKILENVHLQSIQDHLADEISYGQQKLLTIGCCLANDAQLLLLDEPVAGIDKDNYNRIKDLIIQLRNDGRTILQIEHNHNFVEQLSDGIWFLNDGKATFFSDYRSFMGNKTVKEVYLN